ncbi:hypothetical protein IWQ62_003064 [Dispira parvispora]|uniref:N-acetyltransferase domain-containing protein n=1 Tax=Dispira parvispora TaxID=1520584 RepID=A0A9W8E6L8_9FUNG|nr:hypothetical protein IWQ62_003064 [Dispira parvispora]
MGNSSVLNEFLYWTLAYCASLANKVCKFPWGVAYLNAENPTHHQSNQAHVLVPLAKCVVKDSVSSSPTLTSVLADITTLYSSHGIVPRVIIYPELQPLEKNKGEEKLSLSLRTAHQAWRNSQQASESLSILQYDPRDTTRATRPDAEQYRGVSTFADSEAIVRKAHMDDLDEASHVVKAAFGYDQIDDTAWIRPKLEKQLDHPDKFDIYVMTWGCRTTGEKANPSLNTSYQPSRRGPGVQEVDHSQYREHKVVGIAVVFHPPEKEPVWPSCSISTPVHLVQMIAIHPDYQKRGLGTLLLRTLCQKTPSHTKLYIETTSSDSKRLYTQCGFKEVGVVDSVEFWLD